MLRSLMTALVDFFSQPFGAVGAVCIMLAVTVINSVRLRARLDAMGIGAERVGVTFNALNLVGGLCLLVNAVMRREVVWEVLEVYFVAVAAKGLLQAGKSGAEADAVPMTGELLRE